MTSRHVSEFSLTVDILMGEEPCCLTVVYGPQVDVDKVQFLDELRAVHATVDKPWIAAGDFNLILNAADKSNDNINRRNMGRFWRFVEETEIKDVHLHGRSYTWSNERDNPTLVKLDRVLVSIDFETIFPNCFLQALSSDFSDHAPLLLSTNANFQTKKRFHFENYWIKLPDYLPSVQRAWNSNVPEREPCKRLDLLLRNASRELQSWGQKRVGQIKEQILVAREIIFRLDKVQEMHLLPGQESQLRRELKLKSLGLASLERTITRM